MSDSGTLKAVGADACSEWLGTGYYLRAPEPLSPTTPLTPSPDAPFDPNPDTFAVSVIGFSGFVTASLALTCPLEGPSTA